MAKRPPSNEFKGPQDTTCVIDLRRETVEVPAVNPAAQLVVVTGREIGRTCAARDGLVIGRGEEAELQIAGAEVSRRHARLRARGEGQLAIEDLGSRNGTQVNGVQIERTHPLDPGDRIRLGAGTMLMFSRADPLEEQLRQSQRMESLGKLAGGVAHDFGNLLASLQASIGHLQHLSGQGPEVSSAQLEPCLTDMTLAVKCADELTYQLLDFARPSKHSLRPVDLSQLVQEVLGLARRTFNPAVTVSTEITPELIVTGEQTQLHQVLMNLCVNARDALGAAGGKLAVRAREILLGRPETPCPPVLAPGWYAQIEVEDDGAGMDAQTRARIFEPFFSTKAEGDGTGLGLAVTFRIVKNHGGHIEVHSAPGEGASFKVYLPS